MDRVWFETPVSIALGTAKNTHNVSNVIQAADVLAYNWSGKRGPAHLRASKICRAALIGDASSRDAREAFHAAAREAQILMI